MGYGVHGKVIADSHNRYYGTSIGIYPMERLSVRVKGGGGGGPRWPAMQAFRRAVFRGAAGQPVGVGHPIC
jgi:hypothetical protein